jgi:hypothetical protein
MMRFFNLSRVYSNLSNLSSPGVDVFVALRGTLGQRKLGCQPSTGNVAFSSKGPFSRKSDVRFDSIPSDSTRLTEAFFWHFSAAKSSSETVVAWTSDPDISVICQFPKAHEKSGHLRILLFAISLGIGNRQYSKHSDTDGFVILDYRINDLQDSGNGVLRCVNAFQDAKLMAAHDGPAAGHFIHAAASCLLESRQLKATMSHHVISPIMLSGARQACLFASNLRHTISPIG